MVHVNAQSARPRNPRLGQTGGADIGAGASGADLATFEVTVDAGAVTGARPGGRAWLRGLLAGCRTQISCAAISRPLAASICVFSSLTSCISAAVHGDQARAACARGESIYSRTRMARLTS